MRKLLILLALLLNSVWASAQFSGSGSGTQSDPYLIFNPVQLDQVRNFLGTSGVYFKLMSDIDVAEYIADNNPTQGWQPVGSSSEAFQGVFDGNGKTISGLWINRSTDYTGFWGNLNGATIKNVTLQFSGKCAGGANTGTFVGYMTDGSITNCPVEATTISGGNATGGYIGNLSDATISNCNLTATSISGKDATGGYVGNLSNATISNCNLTATSVSGTVYSKIGGYSGSTTNGNISSSAAIANVSGSSYIGGFVGNLSGTTISNCKAEGNVSGTSTYTGGFIGYTKNAMVSSCSSKGKVTSSTNYVGGFVGRDIGTSTFTSNNHYGDISGKSYVGGFVGHSQYSSFFSNGFNGDITASSDYVAGFCGYYLSYSSSLKRFYHEENTPSAISNVFDQNYSIGNIYAQNSSNVGGIVGHFDAPLTSNKVNSIYILPSVYSAYSSSNTKYYEYIGDTLIHNRRVIMISAKEKSSSTTTKYTLNVIDPSYNVKFQLSNSSSYSIDAMYNSTQVVIGKSINTNCYSANTSNQYYFSGISSSGYVNMTTSSSDYQYCYALLNLSDLKRVSSIQNTISNNYYSGNMTAKDYMGGIVGKTNGYGVHIYNNMSIGYISGNQYVGGIIGHLTSVEGEGAVSLKSNVAINPSLSCVTGKIGRIYGYSDGNSTIGASGTSERNIGLTTCKVSINGVSQTIEDNLQNGDSRGNSTLKLKATYQGIGWDFTNDWTNQETESYPYNPLQTAPPVIQSATTSGATTVSGKTTSGATVYIRTGEKEYKTTASGNTWTVAVDPLQAGDEVVAFAKTSNLDYSYRVSSSVAYEGSGTESDPFKIYSAADLALINSASYYKIMNDIDLTSYISANSPTEGWQPVGRNSTSIAGLDGGNRTISGLWTNTTSDYTGLFASLSSATIKDLTVKVASGKNVKGGSYTGIIAGKLATGTITNCKVEGNVNGSEYTGGMIGYTSSVNFSNCEATGTVTGSKYTGGLSGYLTSAIVSDCIKNGNVSGTDNTAGLIGFTSNVTISNCEVTGNVSGAVNVAGITTNATKNITSVHYNGTITSSGASSIIGGIVGQTTASISLSYSEGSATASGSSAIGGGIAGKNGTGSKITNCYSTMNVTATNYVAGVVGYNLGDVSKCYSSGNLSGSDIGAGVVGYNDGSSAKISNCFALNNIINVSSSTGIAMRVLGGYKNGASDPTMNNYAFKNMAVSVNDIAQIIYDDLLNGAAILESATKQQSTYETAGWDFTDIWTISEGEGYPTFIKDEEEPEITMGDITGDGKINVGDYTALVSMIMATDGGRYSLNTADFNGNGRADVGDLTSLVSLIMSGSSEAKNREASRLKEYNTYSINIDDATTISGDEITFAINLDANATDLNNIQMDLNLPEGISIVDVEKGNLLSRSHSVTYSKIEDKCRLLCSSANNNIMNANEGSVIFVTLRADINTNIKNVNIVLDNILASKTDASLVEITDVKALINFDVTGINDVSVSNLQNQKVYDMTGRQQNAPSKGLYIVNGKKVFIK